jgi:hypothetical protein
MEHIVTWERQASKQKAAGCGKTRREKPPMLRSHEHDGSEVSSLGE